MRYKWFYEYPRAGIGFVEDNGVITNIFFGGDSGFNQIPSAETPLIKQASEQLTEYFAGERKYFDFPIQPAGSVFQKKVWEAVSAIPYGETRSYKEIAVQAGNGLAARAVGMANNRNPLVIVIPCHRVVGHNGALTGYGGGLELKAYLLDLEKAAGRLGS